MTESKLIKSLKGYHYTDFGTYDKKIQKEGLVPSTKFFEFFPRIEAYQKFTSFQSNQNDDLAKKLGVSGFSFGSKEYNQAVRNFLGWSEDSYCNITFAFSEPRPSFMDNHPKFPNLWGRLFADIVNLDSMDPTLDSLYDWEEYKISLLSFDIKPEDNPLICDQSHVIDLGPEVLHNNSLDDNQKVNLVKERLNDYRDSLVSLAQYKGNYSLPFLAFKNNIQPDRLNVEWTKSPREVKKEFGLKRFYVP